MKKTYISPNTEVLVMQAQQMMATSIELQDVDVEGSAAWAPEDKGTFSHAW